MTEFRALPVDDAVTLIRTWAEADWPVTREKTYEIRDKLGWKPTPGHENYFTTNLGFGHEDAGAHFRTSEPNVEKIDFLLARFGSSSIPATNPLVIQGAFEKYCAAMTGLWGDSVESNRQDVMAREWTLCSGAQVRISIAGWFIQALVRSPEAAAQWARDIEFEEMYGFEDEDE